MPRGDRGKRLRDVPVGAVVGHLGASWTLKEKTSTYARLQAVGESGRWARRVIVGLDRRVQVIE